MAKEVQVGERASGLVRGGGVQGRWSGHSTCHRPSCIGPSLPPHVKAMCAQLGLAVCRAAPGPGGRGSKGKPGLAGGRGSRGGERPAFWPWPPGSILGHLVCVPISSLPSKLEAAQPWSNGSLAGQRPEVAARSPRGLLKCLFRKGVPSKLGLGPLLCCPWSLPEDPHGGNSAGPRGGIGMAALSHRPHSTPGGCDPTAASAHLLREWGDSVHMVEG